MPRLANQPWFISSAKRTGCAAQCDSSERGCMSARLTMLPSSAMKAMLSGSSVFFIQKQRRSAWSKTKSMPSFAPIC